MAEFHCCWLFNHCDCHVAVVSDRRPAHGGPLSYAAAIVFCSNIFVVSQTLAGPAFNSTTGMYFWLPTAVVLAASGRGNCCSVENDRRRGPHMSVEASNPVTRIRPTGGWRAIDLGEIWRYRELLYFLAWRDIKLRYKQTAPRGRLGCAATVGDVFGFQSLFRQARQYEVRWAELSDLRHGRSVAVAAFRLFAHAGQQQFGVGTTAHYQSLLPPIDRSVFRRCWRGWRTLS